jgi:hypothetical protein
MTFDDAWNEYNEICQWWHEPTAKGIYEDGWNAALKAIEAHTGYGDAHFRAAITALRREIDV